MASNQKSKYKVGDSIYLHAHARKNTKLFLLCRGTIIRLPTQMSPVYKVKISSVCTTIAGKESKIEEARELLGMKIPCKEDQISGFILTDFMKLAYDTNSWLIDIA